MSAPSQYLTVNFDPNTALSLHRWHPTPPLTALAFPVLFSQGQCAYYTPSHVGRSRSMHFAGTYWLAILSEGDQCHPEMLTLLIRQETTRVTSGPCA